MNQLLNLDNDPAVSNQTKYYLRHNNEIIKLIQTYTYYDPIFVAFNTKLCRIELTRIKFRNSRKVFNRDLVKQIIIKFHIGKLIHDVCDNSEYFTVVKSFMFVIKEIIIFIENTFLHSFAAVMLMKIKESFIIDSKLKSNLQITDTLFEAPLCKFELLNKQINIYEILLFKHQLSETKHIYLSNIRLTMFCGSMIIESAKINEYLEIYHEHKDGVDMLIICVLGKKYYFDLPKCVSDEIINLIQFLRINN